VRGWLTTVLSGVLAAALLTGCGGSSGPPASAEREATLWLCQPSDRHDPCDGDLASTAVGVDGRLSAEKPSPARQPVDCFYVYPTVSQAQTTNAPRAVSDAERQTARAQVARFSSVCRVYAPIYRQVTTKGLFAGKYDDLAARATAHADVVSAWHEYLAKNPDRRFVVIGHSQGTLELLRLLQDEIDPDPALRARLVSALLLGGMVKVPARAAVGGDLKHIPLCRATAQTQCVVAYNAFGSAPAPGSFFGRADRARGLVAACTNPAALGGGAGALLPNLPPGPYARPETTLGELARVTTPYASLPGRLTAECRRTADFSWLQVSARRLPDGRPALVLPTLLGPAWGLHVIDVNLALGNLVELVRAQSR
jgi:hypothetical protein